MSCSCTGNCDLVDINNLHLSDTFHTWYDRTNEIIDAINPLQIYDVNVGMTDGGLTMQTTCIGSNTNGVVTLKVAIGPGIGVGTTVTPNYYLNRTMIDVSNMTIMGSTGYSDAVVASRSLTSFPSNNDWFIVSDSRDASLGSGAGTPKRIKAEHMLPPTVYLPPGFQFNGNLSVNGNLSIQGTQSNIDSNDLRIEDKMIELAYHRLVSIDVTGPTYGNTFIGQGITFYYYDPGVALTADHTTVGQFSSVTNLSSGKTNLKLHNFSEGGVYDIVSGGRLSITGNNFDFTIAAGPTTTESYYDDTTLSEAGFVVHGSVSDKQFLWVNNWGSSPVSYNAFITNTNLGVSGSSNAIISSKFKSYGYNDTNDNTFHFQGYAGGKAAIRLGGLGTGSDPYGYWSIKHDNKGGTGSQQPLVFGFKQFNTAGETASFSIWSGASGPTYDTINVSGQSNNRVGNFAEGLNVDFLDGAHGTTRSTPWSIPVALSTGKIDKNWFVNESISKCYTYTNHSFNIGDLIRLNPDSGTLTGAIATSVQNAEVLGMVSSVADANNFCIVTNGYIYDLTGGVNSNIYDILPLVTGNAYFLSAKDSGALIANPDIGANALEFGNVRKPMLIALSSNSGYINNYLGVVEGVGTDVVDVAGLQPVGMISPWAGDITTIPSGWLLCDGSVLDKSLWSELYAIIGQSYYKYDGGGIQFSSETVNVSTTLLLSSSQQVNLQVNDAVRVELITDPSIFADTYVIEIAPDGDPNLIKLGWFNTSGASPFRVESLHLRGSVDITGLHRSTFFLPDFKESVLVGSSTGITSGNNYLDLSLGEKIGENSLYTPPEHSHSMRTKNAWLNTGAFRDGLDTGIPSLTNFVVGIASTVATDPGTETTRSTYLTGKDITTNGTNMQQSVAINYIIRARKGLNAMILSGHNHDDRYIRYDASHTLNSTNRSVFRNNAKVLGNGYDGDQTFTAKLTVTGGMVVGDNSNTTLTVNSKSNFVGGATFSGQLSISRTNLGSVEFNNTSNLRLHMKGITFSAQANAPLADILIDNGTTSGNWETFFTGAEKSSALKIRGGNDSRASITIFNDGSDQMSVNRMSLGFYGLGTFGSDVTTPRLGGKIEGIVQGFTGGIEVFSRSLVLSVGDENDAALNVLIFNRDIQGAVQAVLPQGLPLATVTESVLPVVLSQNELKIAPTGYGVVPKGGIIIWSGASTAIPSGWALCNGTNNTPDLRDRFIVGAGSSYNVGDSGGSPDAVVVQHSHTGTDDGSFANHRHLYYLDDNTRGADIVGNGGYQTADDNIRIDTVNGGGAGNQGDLVKDLSSKPRNSANQSISSMGITISSNGVSGIGKNLPPYYALCYIMKT